ncbi:AraC family transcriptional regulator ligand-binding domain-containing protein [Nocardia sp. NPDC088792]|uniref:AraC family transcriptional regulator n=1 Tax=Nocardia sp. NPDC088792 TaxID=3364332 RepID=UPI00381CBF07
MSDNAWGVRSTISAALLTDFAESRDMSRAAALSGTGITESRLADPDVEIAVECEFRIIRNILAHTANEPGLGLLTGFTVHLPMLGSLGIALSTCSTVHQMAEIWSRYARISLAYAHYRLEDAGSRVFLHLDVSEVPPDVRRFALERDLAMLRTVQRELLRWDVPVQRLETDLERHPVYEAVGTLLGISDIAFERPGTLLVFEAADLERPVPQAHPLLRQQHEQMCADIIQRRRERVGLSGRVREQLVRRGGLTDQADIAATLNMSVRTLRRRLAEEGTNFRELSTETTGMLAEELLAKGCTVDTVAERLGYSSVSAFAVAFRSWKGKPPGRFARENYSARRTAAV